VPAPPPPDINRIAPAGQNHAAIFHVKTELHQSHWAISWKKKCFAKLEFFVETYYTVKIFFLSSPGADAPPVWLILAGAPSQLVVEASEQLAVVRLCQHQLLHGGSHRWLRAQAQVKTLTRGWYFARCGSVTGSGKNMRKFFFSKIADSTVRSPIFMQCGSTRAERNNGIARASVATLALERSTRLAWSTSALITPTTSTISIDTLTLRRDTLPRAP